MSEERSNLDSTRNPFASKKLIFSLGSTERAVSVKIVRTDRGIRLRTMSRRTSNNMRLIVDGMPKKIGTLTNMVCVDCSCSS